MKGEFADAFWLWLEPECRMTFNHSENIERYRKIIQQRIVAVREEANRKYGNLVESIPLRVAKIVEQKEAAEDDGGEDEAVVDGEAEPEN